MKKILLLTMFLYGCSVTMLDLPKSNNKEIIDRAKLDIKYNLKDPSSAEFRGVKVRQQQGKSVIVVCGQVNGKNSFGGFSGFKGFYYSEHRSPEKITYQSHIVSDASGLENSASNLTFSLFCL